MRAREIMTRDVVVVRRDTPVPEIIELLLERRISGVPVVEDGRVVGIVSAGDLILRERAKRPRTEMAYLAQQLFEDHAKLADEYRKAHGLVAEDVMSREVITCAPGTPIEEIANTMALRHVKRLPVVEANHLVGLVSRSDILRAAAKRQIAFDADRPPDDLSDHEISATLVASLKKEPWAELEHIRLEVLDGSITLHGLAESIQEKEAIELAARTIPGVREVRNQLVVDPNLPLDD